MVQPLHLPVVPSTNLVLLFFRMPSCTLPALLKRTLSSTCSAAPTSFPHVLGKQDEPVVRGTSLWLTCV